MAARRYTKKKKLSNFILNVNNRADIKENLSNSDLEKILIAENNIGDCPSIANKMSKFGMKKSAEIFKKYQNGIELIK